ncbi:hypothetical protein F7725_006297, partial [Dissostichus mawsoni]
MVMNHDDNGDWTVVDYRRGRDKRRGYNRPQDNDSRNRFYQPDHRQYYSGQRSNGRQLSNGQSFNGKQRSYASVTRAGPGTYGDHSSRQRYKEPGYKPQFFEPRYPTGYQNENYMGGITNSHNNNKFNTQYKSNTYPTNRNSHQEKKQYNKQYRNNTYPTYRHTHQEKKPQSEDPDFLLKAHCIHTIIKTIHHLKNVSAEDPPPNIARMTEHLSTVIKPASPRPNTQALIEGNAKNWIMSTGLDPPQNSCFNTGKLKVPSNLPVQEGNKNVLILAKHVTLTPPQITLLDRGLNFIPTKGSNKNIIEQGRWDMQQYHRRLKLATYFKHKKDSDPPPFTPKSDWFPSAGTL